jgi:hypothetical protein
MPDQTQEVTQYRYRRGELVDAGLIRLSIWTWSHAVNEGGQSSSYQRFFLANGSSVVLDYSGTSALGWVRCPEYKKATQEDGSVKLQYTTHGVRVNSVDGTSTKVVSMVEAGQGVDENGENPQDLYAVTLTNGYKFYTDLVGYNRLADIVLP